MMQQMLAQRLMQPQSTSFGGGAAGPQMQGQTTPLNAASQLAQKAMLVRSLQGSQTPPLQQMYQTHQANAGMPAAQAQMANDPQMQAILNNQQPLPMTLPGPQIPQQMPPDGVS